MTASENKIIIAIDGYSSSGKSTMARALAGRLGYRYIDSGAMYRAVTLAAIETGIARSADKTIDKNKLIDLLPSLDIDFEVTPDGKQITLLNGRNVEKLIRGIEVSNLVSVISAIPEVRHELVKKQQSFGLSKGIVMDGRDIGTTVFPDAELKLFVNAPAETRAQRRFNELREKGIESSYDEILENIKLRDHLDETREESPLRRASDAIDVDNSNLSIEEQDTLLDSIVSDRLKELAK